MNFKKCIECACSKRLVPIFKKGTSIGSPEDYSRKAICKDCFVDSEDYGICPLCGDVGAYHSSDLINGYCEEHSSEVAPGDEEEAEDLDSYTEYFADPSH